MAPFSHGRGREPVRERITAVLNVLTTLAFLAVLALAARFAFGSDPHWCSKDGRRFSCRARIISQTTGPTSRWIEARAAVTPDGLVYLRPRGLTRHNIHGEWHVAGVDPSGDAKRRIYVLRRGSLLTIRVPAKSRCVAVLDELVAS